MANRTHADAAAMLDRLLDRSVVLNLDGDSYRLRDHQHEPESGGLAYAAHGVAASPAPDAQSDRQRSDAPECISHTPGDSPLPAQPRAVGLRARVIDYLFGSRCCPATR